MTYTKLVNGFPFTRYKKAEFPMAKMIAQSRAFYNWANLGRTCRDISNKELTSPV